MVFRAPVSLDELNGLSRSTLIEHLGIVFTAAGEDWLRYEPRLQSPASGKSSIRLRLREWADHVLFMGYDVNVKDGKGQGAGTRTLYPAELTHCMAKSRTCQTPIPVAGDPADLWKTLFNLPE